MDKCDFCRRKRKTGVYATDYAPVSLCYCKECIKVHNIRPLEVAVFGWARLGENYFTPYESDDIEYPPMVYYEGKYISVEELIKNLSEENIYKWFKPSFRLELIIKKFKESKNI